jgi:hypothetical protein
MEHLIPSVVMDIGQPVPMPTTGGQSLIRMVTIDDAMPFHILISSDAEVSLMNLQVFLTMQIPVLGLVRDPLSKGLG